MMDSARLKRVFVEQDGQVVAVSVSVELVGDVRSVISGFMEDHTTWKLPQEALRCYVGLLRAGLGFTGARRGGYWLCMRLLTEMVSGMSNAGLGAPQRDMGGAQWQRHGEVLGARASCSLGVGGCFRLGGTS